MFSILIKLAAYLNRDNGIQEKKQKQKLNDNLKVLKESSC